MAIRFTVTGRVQGVGFRASARSAAHRLGVVGWIRNHESGRSVEGEATGAPEALEAFLAWCKSGPPGSRVDDIVVESVTVDDEWTELVIRR